jgi:hypothetical protein
MANDSAMAESASTMPCATGQSADRQRAAEYDLSGHYTALAAGLTVTKAHDATSEDAAADQGTTQKLAFVTVNSITTDNDTGVLTVTAKAWKVPQ